MLAIAGQKPTVGAGALYFICQRLTESGITPELFDGFQDKEYCGEITAAVNAHTDRFLNELPPEKRQAAIEAAHALRRVPEYRLVLEYEPEAAVYESKQKFVNNRWNRRRYKSSLSALTRNQPMLWFWRGTMTLFASSLLCIGTTEGVVGVMLVGLLVIAGLAYIVEKDYRQYQRYQEALAYIEDEKNRARHERFLNLKTRFGGPRADIRGQLNRAEATVREFFGKVDLAFLSTYG